MRWFKLSLISKTEFFNEIFEDFICIENQVYKNELWKSNSIIRLMQISCEIEDTKIIEDGLKIILNLSKFQEGGSLVDSYESESYSVNELIEPEKKILESILKAEFI